MTCDLKKLGCFFFFFFPFSPVSPWDETFCANDVSWYEHNADVGVCHEDAYNSPCPWPPSQEGSKHSEVTPWAVSCQTGDPSLSLEGAGWVGRVERLAARSWIEAEGYTTLLCFCWCHSHTRKKTHSLHQSEPPPQSTSVPSVPAYSVSGELVVLHEAEAVVWLSRGGDTARKVSDKPGINQERE